MESSTDPFWPWIVIIPSVHELESLLAYGEPQQYILWCLCTAYAKLVFTTKVFSSIGQPGHFHFSVERKLETQPLVCHKIKGAIGHRSCLCNLSRIDCRIHLDKEPSFSKLFLPQNTGVHAGLLGLRQLMTPNFQGNKCQQWQTSLNLHAAMSWAAQLLMFGASYSSSSQLSWLLGANKLLLIFVPT